jgi:hypothetical protein
MANFRFFPSSVAVYLFFAGFGVMFGKRAMWKSSVLFMIMASMRLLSCGGIRHNDFGLAIAFFTNSQALNYRILMLHNTRYGGDILNMGYYHYMSAISRSIIADKTS